MKRIMTILITGVLSLSFVACGQTASITPENAAVQADETKTVMAEITDTTQESPGITDAVSQNTEAYETSVSSDSSDVLILYFSAANLNDVDAVSSATPLIDGASSVEWMADLIQDRVGGEIVKIMPVDDYPILYQDVADAAKQEADNEVHPQIQPLPVDPTGYKTVFIGYPMWWYRMPMVLETFFDTYDFSGVTIIPFNTHEGSRDGGTYNMIRDREPYATVLDGVAIRGEDAGKDSSIEAINTWIDSLDLE